MRLSFLIPAAAAALWTASAAAQQPRETPPAGYAGAQFVDSTGCVFVRDGGDWVARLDRAGQPVCARVALAPRPAAAPQPAQEPRPAVAAQPRRTAAPLRVTVTRAATWQRIPPGYKAAWTDGRLNPHRAKGTPEGEAAMYRLWTRTVPARLVSETR